MYIRPKWKNQALGWSQLNSELEEMHKIDMQHGVVIRWTEQCDPSHTCLGNVYTINFRKIYFFFTNSEILKNCM